ncbi:MAG TPA: hypothetical protein VJ761_18880 [Ktedonobacteraceae bacterium]|nr:hypothetical protein [Ktedonobacteraceae bacterium]
MLNYAETASSSTIVSVTPLPPNPSPGATASLFSYAIGPIAPRHVLSMQVQLSEGEEACTLLMPLHVPPSILTAPAFQDGYTYNYLSEEEGGAEAEEWRTSIPRVVNYIYTSLTDDCCYRDLETGAAMPEFLPWQVGWLLRDLTRLAQTDLILAYVGIAHLRFVLTLLTHERPADWPRSEVHLLHRRAIKAYRARVRLYREQGKSYQEAQQLALVTQMQ